MSTISVFQFEEDKKNKDLVFALNIIITVMTVSITLVASWMKKQNYVGKISECEKYLESLSSVISELKGQFDILPEDRVKYSIFLEKYKDKIVNFESSLPLISPFEYKHTVFLLSKYYPELIDDLYPWNGDDQYKEKIIETFHNVKYNTLYRKIAYGYFFTSNFWYCCKKKKTALENVVTDKDKSKENQSESKENQSESKENQSESKGKSK